MYYFYLHFTVTQSAATPKPIEPGQFKIDASGSIWDPNGGTIKYLQDGTVRVPLVTFDYDDYGYLVISDNSMDFILEWGAPGQLKFYAEGSSSARAFINITQTILDDYSTKGVLLNITDY